MKPSKKNKKRRSRRTDGYVAGDQKNDEKHRVLNWLTDVFALASLDEAASAYREADGDANKAAEILGGMSENGNDPSTTDSSLSDRFTELNSVQNRGKGFRGNKQKKIVASAGSVSSVLGKDYMPSTSRKDCSKWNSLKKEPINYEEAEQFLCSMLGDECELSMAVVRDVLSYCGSDVEKALDALLDLSAASSYERFKNGSSDDRSKIDKHDPTDNGDGNFWNCQLIDRESYSTSQSSENELQEILQSGYDCRPGTITSDLPQKVLESLFNIPKNSEHEPKGMNWKDVVMKLESLGQGLDLRPAGTAKLQQDTEYAEGDEYQASRKAAKQHWDSMRFCYQKAATAYTRGEQNYAAYLSEQGKSHKKMAQEADEKASQEIFEARNKRIENVITIDLHGQHVKQAIRLLKIHFAFSTYISSIQFLRVITGCGSHGVGKGKLKQSVISLLRKEGVEWSEENQGTVLIKLGKQRQFSFLESNSDTE